MASFTPRRVFPTLNSLPRSYFLGHHAAGLTKMKTMLSYIDLVIECRDYRVPLTSRNPLFEENLGGRERLIVHTKQDLGSAGKPRDKVVGQRCLKVQIKKGSLLNCYAHRERSSFGAGTCHPASSSRTTKTSHPCAASSTSPKPTPPPKTP